MGLRLYSFFLINFLQMNTISTAQTITSPKTIIIDAPPTAREITVNTVKEINVSNKVINRIIQYQLLSL